ncbi:MAG: hypothetical protein ACRCYZ_04815 [Alphaproteobacteria bacterium]
MKEFFVAEKKERRAHPKKIEKSVDEKKINFKSKLVLPKKLT